MVVVGQSHGSNLHAAKELDKLAMWICGAKKIEEDVKDMVELSDSIKGLDLSRAGRRISR
jgi:hypothetical protein